MSLTIQMFTAFFWIIIVLVFMPIIWLLVQPYLKIWTKAERRAAHLLRDLLTPEQQRQLVWRGYLDVRSPSAPDRIYRVPRTRGYVQVIDNGRATMHLCLQPVECLPDADVVILHKLMIEANEEIYLQKSNKYLCLE